MKLEPMHVILAVGFMCIAVSFWRAHRTPEFQFNAFDLVMENGKVSKIAVSYMLVLGVTTWVIVDLQVKDKMTEGYFIAYAGAWIAPLVAKVVFGKTEMPGSSSTTKTMVTQETTEKVAP